MKLKLIASTLFVFTIMFNANAQNFDLPKKHNFGAGVSAGYDLDEKGLVYGAGGLYEFRPFQKIGFTAGFNYDRMRKDVSGQFWGDFEGSPVYGDAWVHELFSLHVGARYYMDKFYLGGALGVGRDSGYTNLSDGTTADGGHAYDLYKGLSAGYQLPLKNGNAIEFEANFYGTRSMKIGGTVRYKFGK